MVRVLCRLQQLRSGGVERCANGADPVVRVGRRPHGRRHAVHRSVVSTDSASKPRLARLRDDCFEEVSDTVHFVRVGYSTRVLE